MQLLQAGQLAEKARELEAKLVSSQQQSRQLSAAIEQEQRKIRFYFGHDLEQLSCESLQELEQFHQRSLARLAPRLVCGVPTLHPACCIHTREAVLEHSHQCSLAGLAPCLVGRLSRPCFAVALPARVLRRCMEFRVYKRLKFWP